MTEIPMKHCRSGSECVHPNGPRLPATCDYFPKHQRSRDGLAYICIACRQRYDYIRRHNNDSQAYELWVKEQEYLSRLSEQGLRHCSKKENCSHPDGPILPETTEYFRSRKVSTMGLHSICRACESAYGKRPEVRERNRKYGKSEIDRQRKKEWYHRPEVNDRLKQKRNSPEHKAYMLAYNQNEAAKSKKREYARSERGKELHRIYSKTQKAREWKRAYQKSDKRRNYMKEYRQREHVQSYFRTYRANPVHKERANASSRRSRQREEARRMNRLHSAKYRARKAQLPDTLTPDQWEMCIAFFLERCAYCGIQAKSLEADHFIPITRQDCPGTIVTNIIPACRRCNSSKGNRPIRKWLARRYGNDTAHEILAFIEAYLEWVRQSTE